MSRDSRVTEVHAEPVHPGSDGMPGPVPNALLEAAPDKNRAGDPVHVRAPHRRPLGKASLQKRKSRFPRLDDSLEYLPLGRGRGSGAHAEPGDVRIDSAE